MDAFAPQSSRARSSLVAAAVLILVVASTDSLDAASARTRNFVVTAPTRGLANEIAQAAERFRHDLAVEWLGAALPDWSQPCPIVAHVNPNMGAGGRTSFMFERRTPFGWEMEIQGSRERILDSVLPHEVTHTIFATHFGRPLPRWADEGACTTVEHVSERRKQEQWLIQFLRTERGIPFNRMFAMTEYPGDIMPLYSQGYSLARYLIAQGGKPKFVTFVEQGLDTNDWTGAVYDHYGYRTLGDLQVTWVDWVAQGSRPDSIPAPGQVQLASAESAVPQTPRGSDTQQRDGTAADFDGTALASRASSRPQDGRSWYARRQGQQPHPPGRAPEIERTSDSERNTSSATLPSDGWRSRSDRTAVGSTEPSRIWR